MAEPVRIAIVADYNGGKSHVATENSLKDSAAALSLPIEVTWIRTSRVGVPAESLGGYAGIWAGPASPYESFPGALAAIRFARERRIPMLGTCGGFQHTVIEAARNLLGMPDADHEETAPGANSLVISRLTCSLYGRQMTIRFSEGSRLREIYGCETAEEDYICNFGVNPTFIPALKSVFRIAASDPEGEVRGIELTDHPFLIATLFLPQHRSRANKPHPLVTAFVRAAAGLN